MHVYKKSQVQIEKKVHIEKSKKSIRREKKEKKKERKPLTGSSRRKPIEGLLNEIQHSLRKEG